MINMLLLVEDNKLMAENIKTIFELNNIEIESVETAEKALEILKKKEYELIILDINLPGMNGFNFLEKIRKSGNNIPVLILTSKNTIEDKIEGLEIGADDYMTKPFDMDEMLLRIKSILKRTNNEFKSDEIIIKDIHIYPEKKIIKKGGGILSLSNTEIDIFLYLLKNKDRIISKKEIAKKVLNDIKKADNSRVIDIYISNIRKKTGINDIIKSKSGVGYYLNTNID